VAGLAARAAGNLPEARRLFTRAVEATEAQRSLLPIEELRAAFLGDKTAIYADLILSLLDLPQEGGDAVTAAFDMVERARSRALLERLLSAVDDAQATAGLAPQVREQIIAARSRLAWLYNQLLNPGGGGSRGGATDITAELRAQEATLQRLEWQRSEWLQQAQPATLTELQAQLAHDQAALVYFIAGEEVLAFIVTRQAAQVQRNIANAGELDAAQAQWRFQLGRVEIGGDYPERHHARLLAGARAALRRLHELLIAPLLPQLVAQAGTEPVRRLLVVPYGPLHLIPFHALWDGQRYLLEAYEIACTASASLLVHCRNGRGGAGRRPTVGEAIESAPTGNGQREDEYPLQALAAVALADPAIPQAENEVRAAARHFSRAQLFLHEQAGSAGLQTAAQTGDVLHIATHGIFRPDNPFFSALKLADGWIDVRAIYRLPLTARLVVLSACESGAVQVQGSDEAIGLGRGFLGAGAQTLVVSLWNVHDASAAYLMEQFYAQLAERQLRTAGALRAAQQEAAAADRHPYYWAPYIVMGDL
jgi:CHAT domain-containing protein